MLNNTQAYLNKMADLIQRMLVRKISQDNKVASGRLRNSIEVFVNVERDGINLQVYAIDYAKFLLTGRRKGAKQPPINAILMWLVQKRIGIGGGKKRTLTGQARITNKEKLKGLAFVIARSIAKKGIKPYNWRMPYDNVVHSLTFIKGLKQALVLDGEYTMSELIKTLNRSNK
jgi:hypothetical protein